ncbi:MAG: YihY/virulence factor BrkB family protein [Rhodospirillaceae bacterium]
MDGQTTEHGQEEGRSLRDRALSFTTADYWERGVVTHRGWRFYFYRSGAVIRAVIRDAITGQLTLWAMSLVYTTLLSLVPLLAISFSVLKGFGVHNQVAPALSALLAPFGEQGNEIVARIVEFVDNVKVGVLGSVGLALLVYTVISLMQKIEAALNVAWRVGQERTLGQRFSHYLSVIAIGPLLVFGAIGLSARATSVLPTEAISQIEPVGWAMDAIGFVVPYLMVVAAFTFIYAYMPNTRVRIGSALVGGMVAGLLWQVVGWGFATFVVRTSSYTAIYSAFATALLFMIWLYVGWLILLVGASVAYYHQNPQNAATPPGVLLLSARMRERIALTVAGRIVATYYDGGRPWTIDALSQALSAPNDAVHWAVCALERAGLICATDGEPPGYVPARPPEETPALAVLEAARSADERQGFEPASLPADGPVAAVLAESEEAATSALRGLCLRDLATGPAAAKGTESRLSQTH